MQQEPKIFGNQIIKDGKSIKKIGQPIVHEIIIAKHRVKYMFWKVTVLSDFEEIWEGSDRQIQKDSVEHSFLYALITKNGHSFGENLTVWDGIERKAELSHYWYNNNNEGDRNLDVKDLKDLYMGEWAIVDENGIPVIDKKYREWEKKLKLLYNEQEVQAPLYQTPSYDQETTVRRITPQVQPKQGNIHVINQPNPVTQRGKLIQVGGQPQPIPQPRPIIRINRNF